MLFLSRPQHWSSDRRSRSSGFRRKWSWISRFSGTSMVETSLKYPRKNIKFSDFKQAEEADQKIRRHFAKWKWKRKKFQITMQVKINSYMTDSKTHEFSVLTPSWGWKRGKVWQSSEETCFSQYRGIEDAWVTGGMSRCHPPYSPYTCT